MLLAPCTRRPWRPGLGQHNKNGANKAAIDAYNVEAQTDIEVRRCKYLNNIVEQSRLVDRGGRVVQQKMVGVPGLQTFHAAMDTLAGFDLVHMIRNGQIRPLANGSNAGRFSALAV